MDIDDLTNRAESGDVVAQGVLGICYFNGTDVEIDYSKAFRLLSAAADRGASRPIAYLGRMYAEGLGVPRVLSTARVLYERAARRGEFLAQVELGRMYSQGATDVADHESALKWYLEALKQEDRVYDCEELREAKAYVASHIKE
jgi:TPR repeat protein